MCWNKPWQYGYDTPNALSSGRAFLYIKHEFVAVSCKKAGSCSLKSCVLDKMADIRLRATEDLVYVKKSVHLDANR